MYNLVPVIQSYLRRELIGRCIDGYFIVAASPVLKPEDIALLRPICTMSGMSDYLHIDLTVTLHGYRLPAGVILLGGTITKKLDESLQQVIVTFKRRALNTVDPITIRVVLEGVDANAAAGNINARIVRAEYRAHTDDISCSGVLVRPMVGPIAHFRLSELNPQLRSEAVELLREHRKNSADSAYQTAYRTYNLAACVPVDKVTFLKRTVDAKPIDVGAMLGSSKSDAVVNVATTDAVYLDFASLLLYPVHAGSAGRLPTLSFGAGPQIVRPEQIDTDAMIILLIEHLRSLESMVV